VITGVDLFLLEVDNFRRSLFPEKWLDKECWMLSLIDPAIEIHSCLRKSPYSFDELQGIFFVKA
jgi:hypothetical protein